MNTLYTSVSGIFIAGLLAGSAVAQITVPAIPVKPLAPAVPDTGAVGLGARDGITLSGSDVLITRNGVIEKMTKVTKLPNGLVVGMDGTVTTAEGTKFPLRQTQLVTFDGTIIDLEKGGAGSGATSPASNIIPRAATTTTTTVTTPVTNAATITPVPTTGTSAVNEKAAEISKEEAKRRAQGTDAAK